MSKDCIAVRRRPLMEFLTCPICSNLYREATTICVCLHTFCKRCIYQKLEKENRNHCPVCNAYLGTFPEEMIRNDLNLQRLVIQIFPIEDINEPVTIQDDQNVLGNDIHLSQRVNDIQKQNELNDSKMPEIDNGTSEPMDRAFALERSKEVPCWGHLLGHEGETYYTKFNVQVKRRRTKRKPCKFLTAQRQEFSNIGTESEMSKFDPSGLGKSIDLSNRCNENVYPKQHPGYFPRPVWFCLHACQEKTSMTLPQIPKPFISTKNGDLSVTFVNKYLARKLNLKHESEVEVMCFGRPLIPTLTLNNLVNIWLEAFSDIGPVSVNVGENDGRNFLMELTYRRSYNQCVLL